MKNKKDYFSQNTDSLLSLFVAAMIVLIAGLAGIKIADTNSYNYMAFAENQSVIVTIPKGAASPEVDITKLTPTQWYIPPRISVNQNDSVMWINKDTEIHTVTSGNGAGLESLMTNKRGTKNGIFDSGIIKPGENWTHLFENTGTFAYFCTVHPWMEGTVVVKKVGPVTIPNYPVDASGQRQKVIPVHTITKDNKYDIDMAWTPRVLLTGQRVSFILDFSDPLTSKRLHLLPYDFVLSQNGDELLRKSGFSQIGSDVQEFVFSKAGPINVRIEMVGDGRDSFSEFNSTVYEKPNASEAQIQQPQTSSSNLPADPFKVSTLTLVWITYAVIFGIPVAVAVTYFLYRKGKI